MYLCRALLKWNAPIHGYNYREHKKIVRRACRGRMDSGLTAANPASRGGTTSRCRTNQIVTCQDCRRVDYMHTNTKQP